MAPAFFALLFLGSVPRHQRLKLQNLNSHGPSFFCLAFFRKCSTSSKAANRDVRGVHTERSESVSSLWDTTGTVLELVLAQKAEISVAL